MASQNAGNLLGWTLTGRRAADCAFSNALRPSRNYINTEKHYELSFIGETPAPFARRLSTQGRPGASPRSVGKSAHQNILAAGKGIFWRQHHKHKATSAGWP